jgi:hypothetical protein
MIKRTPPDRPSLGAFVRGLFAVLAFLLISATCKPTPDRKALPAPRPSARILTNQVGYGPLSPKRAVVQARAGDTFTSFAVKRYPGGETVLAGAPIHDGAVAKWKDWDFWTVDWSAVTSEGTYVVECASPDGPVRSHPVLVQKSALLRNTLSDVLYYFKGQRSSGLWDKADRAMIFEGRPGLVDVHGGWFDASGDYGKHLSHLSYSSYFNPQQISLTSWALFRALRALEAPGAGGTPDPLTRQYRKRLLDEALYGADYLVRIKDPSGSFIISVSGRGPEKKPEDRRITAKAERHIILTPETKDRFRDYGRERISGDAAYEAGFREGAGLCIAALAMAAARGGAAGRSGGEGYGVSRGEGDFTAADYLKAAEDAYVYLEKNNLLFTNDGEENIIDDTCALLAATELFRTTKKPAYRAAADRRAASLMGRLTAGPAGRGRSVNGYYWSVDGGDRPFFHPVDAGLPTFSLLDYAFIADPESRARALDSVEKAFRFELALTEEVTNPFGYARQLVQSKRGEATRRSAFFFPHDTETAPWWQGENARLGSLAAAATLAAKALSERSGGTPEEGKALREFTDRVFAYGRAQLDWILGLNPYDACMLHGHGRNNIDYLFFDSWEYTNAPGGICNGITGGYADEGGEGIDFGLRYAETGKDDDWRWAEQWLPHAAWYLLAVAIGD